MPRACFECGRDRLTAASTYQPRARGGLGCARGVLGALHKALAPGVPAGSDRVTALKVQLIALFLLSGVMSGLTRQYKQIHYIIVFYINKFIILLYSM